MESRSPIDSRPPARGESPRSRFWTSGVLLALGLVGILMVLAAYQISEQRIAQDAPLESAAAEIQSSLANAHLLLEDRLTVGALTDVDEVWELLERADSMISALLFGGQARSGPAITAPLSDPALSESMQELQELLGDYRAAARRRIELHRSGNADRQADIEYDEALGKLLATTAAIEHTVRRRLSDSQRRARYLVAVLSIAWLLLVALAVYWIASREAQRRATAEKLRQSEQRLAATLRSLAEGVIATDREGRVTFANRAARNLLGLAGEDLIGMPLPGIFRPREHASGQPWIVSVERFEEEPRSAAARDLDLPRADGSSIAIEANASPIRDDTIFRGIVVAFRDVTERKQAEARFLEQESQLHQAQKMEAIGRFAGGLAHDINNYLATIVTQVELTQRDASPGFRGNRRLEAILEAVAKASSLIRRLLAFSRQQPTRRELVDLDRVSREMADMLRQLVGEGVSLDLDLASDAALVETDPAQIAQILANLVLNSREAMPDGGRILVRTSNAVLRSEDLQGSPQTRPGPFVLLQVEDEGCGIRAGDLDHIFEPFFTTKRSSGNSGLGLSTVYGIVQQNGGSLRVASRAGRGTTVSVYLPRAAAQGAAHPAGVESAVAAPVARTLLVEDDAALRASLAALLEEMGHRVETTGSCEQAEKLFAADRFQLLITDIALPDGLGTDLAESCREISPDLAVLLMSGRVPAADVRHSLAQARTRFLVKPFDGDQLRAAVAELRPDRGIPLLRSRDGRGPVEPPLDHTS